MKNIYTLCVAVAVLLSTAVAQSDVFNPNDPVTTYDPARPPALPAANTIAKWVRSKVQNWNTDNFKCYYYNGMAFRLRYPNGYNPADRTKKYPIVVFFHGAGETAYVTDNEVQLSYTGQKLEAMVNDGRYNAFLLYPLESQPGIWEDTHFKLVNNILDSLEKYCRIDPDRVLTMGISMGAFATMRYGAWYPQRSTLALGASPALLETLTNDNKDKLLHIPMWFGNGGFDVNPIPLYVKNFVDYIVQKGGNIKQNYYPLLGHDVWTTLYDEPILLTYMLDAHKANPVLFYGKDQYDQEWAVDARMGLSAGFYAYEWQKDNVLIASAVNGNTQYINTSVVSSYTGNEIKVRNYGTYRVRFKRTAATDWSEWSPKPVVISGMADRIAPAAPVNLKSVFSTRTSIDLAWDASADNTGIAQYDVYVNGALKISTTNTNITIDGLTPHTSNTYTVKAVDKAGNTSATSNAITVYSEANGLRYKFYQGSWSTLPDFNMLTPVAKGTSQNIDINVRPSTVNSNYGFVWEGFINIRVAGTYTFETGSDDGSKLYFNAPYAASANALVNNDGIHPFIFAASTPAYLAVGVYPVTITFFQKDAGQNMALYWSGPGFSRQPMPDIAFTEAAQDNSPSLANGLKYRYYEGNWDSLPEFNALVPLKTGTSANIDMSSRTQNDYFAYMWEGYINIKTPGNYTFETASDDGSKIYFNSFYSPSATPLVKNNGIHPLWSVKGTVYIPAAGAYPIAITYFEKQGSEIMQLYWEGPNFSRQPIPDAAFTGSLSSTASTNAQARVLAENTDNEPMGLSRISAYPNPFTSELKINFYNNATGNNVSAGIYDLSGKLLYNKNYGKLPAGVNLLQLNIQNVHLNAGTYIARLQVNGLVTKTWKVIKVKR